MIYDHEEEIKIEYYDNDLSDPLSENCISMDNAYCNENVTFKKHAKTNKLQYRNNGSIQPETGIVNWYKDIDDDGRYLCKFCELKFSSIQTLRYHVSKKHVIEAENLKCEVKNNKRRHKTKCHICNERFQHLNDLKLHFNSAHNDECLVKSCSYCDATFESVSEITEHQLNVHTSIKKPSYVCTICGYRTSKKSHYNQHENTHSNIKKLECKYCDYHTNYSPNLKIHERIHTNIKPYKCDFKNCTYSCAAKSALRSHKLKHFPNENMLYCDKCSYKTVYRQSLKKHQDSHNRNNIVLRIV